jgi:NTP pyrophosphatase (non-canonical NTP hydrolase)
MEKAERIRLYEKAINKWGVEAQRNMAFEELGELNTILARDRRGRATKEEILTELADVTIMCEQMAVILGFEDYEKELDNKLIRLRDKKLKLNDNN